MRNRSYIKRGSVIDVQIRGEYYVSAYITHERDGENKFKCKLSIHDTESGFSVELDKNPVLTSSYKTVNIDVAQKLNLLIDRGYFDEYVKNIENLIVCMNQLILTKEKND